MGNWQGARVALVGLGPIGIEVGRALAGRDGIELLGAADPASDIAGRDVNEAIRPPAELPRSLVEASAPALYGRSSKSRGKRDVVVLCTGSRLERVVDQIEEALDAGFHVVSTCEELSYPALRHEALARRLDAKCRKMEVSALGTGVNPGLVMDRLALAAAAACVRVDRVRVTRVVDAARRRGPLRSKVGAGLTTEEFAAGVAARKLGHVGLSESAAILALGLGLPSTDIRETIEPVIAERETDGIAAGRVLGLHQVAHVRANGGDSKVVLDLTMAVGVENPGDSIQVEGDPPLDVRVPNGFHGDRATVGCVVNAIPFVLEAPPALHTVVTLPLFGLFPVPASS